jgi:hypothetical protein
MTQQEAAPSSIEYCLARAEDAQRMAAEMADEKNKAILQELAIRWRRLAKESDGDALKPIGPRRARY